MPAAQLPHTARRWWPLPDTAVAAAITRGAQLMDPVHFWVLHLGTFISRCLQHAGKQ